MTNSISIWSMKVLSYSASNRHNLRCIKQVVSKTHSWTNKWQSALSTQDSILAPFTNFALVFFKYFYPECRDWIARWLKSWKYLRNYYRLGEGFPRYCYPQGAEAWIPYYSLAVPNPLHIFLIKSLCWIEGQGNTRLSSAWNWSYSNINWGMEP